MADGAHEGCWKIDLSKPTLSEVVMEHRIKQEIESAAKRLKAFGVELDVVGATVKDGVLCVPATCICYYATKCPTLEEEESPYYLPLADSIFGALFNRFVQAFPDIGSLVVEIEFSKGSDSPKVGRRLTVIGVDYTRGKFMAVAEGETVGSSFNFIDAGQKWMRG